MSKKHKIKNIEKRESKMSKKRKVKSIQVPDGYEPLYPEYYEVQDINEKTPWYKKRPTKKQVLVGLSIAGSFVLGGFLVWLDMSKKNAEKWNSHESFLEGLPEVLNTYKNNKTGQDRFLNEEIPSFLRPLAEGWIKKDDRLKEIDEEYSDLWTEFEEYQASSWDD